MLFKETLGRQSYKKFLLDIIKETCPPKKRCIYSDSYYLDNIILVLTELVSWKSLRNIHPQKPHNHYKTIQDKFLLWSNNKIFEKAYNKLITEEIVPKCNSHTTLNLYIDSSDIHNNDGIEMVKTGKNKKKKVTEISYICDNNKTVYDVSFYEGNVSDVKTIIPSINPIINKILYRRINLIGDKGYISKDRGNELRKSKVFLITPKRKNMHIKTRSFEKKKLKNRYIIEHCIRENKIFNRVSFRKDKLINTYKSFVYLALIIRFNRFNP